MGPSVKIKSPKKLIEVALPLDIINAAAVREKSIRHGHPSTLHPWWARRPLAAARAVIFAQMVNDPGFQNGDGFEYGMNKADAQAERQRLLGIMAELVKWENTNNEDVLEAARKEIRRSWLEVCELNKDHPEAGELFNPEKLPAFHDPFAGGGSLPLEAQRLGFESYASDLNPVAVLINKAMIEIPPRFAGRAPVGPIPPETDQTEMDTVWSGAMGLAEDVRRYGAWIRAEAENRIGHLYPKVEISEEMASARPDLQSLLGQKLTVIAWIWARTVKSPNPLFSDARVPLVTNFVLSSKAGSERWVKPVVAGDRFHFEIKVGTPPPNAKNGTKLSRGASFNCLLSNTPIEPKYIKREGVAGRIGVALMAIVAEGKNRRVYLPPTELHEAVARLAQPQWKPTMPIPPDRRAMFTPLYGLCEFGDLFTPRQLTALSTLSDLIPDAVAMAKVDALASGVSDDGSGLDHGGAGASAYAEAIGVYLSLGVSRLANAQSSMCKWAPNADQTLKLFSRQAIPMVWDHAESNAFSNAAGDISTSLGSIARVLDKFTAGCTGHCAQSNAQTQTISYQKAISTDPPYYDNIGYADLSEFFYVWLRRSLKATFPALFATIGAPKEEELIAAAYRHTSKAAAETFFLDGMSETLCNLARLAHPGVPLTIYYAFKQSETTTEAGTISTGWDTFLEAVIKAGFIVTGTWPMRTA